jgi:hypothetical protein
MRGFAGSLASVCDDDDDDDEGDDDDGVATGCEPPQAAMARTLTTRTAARRIHRR